MRDKRMLLGVLLSIFAFGGACSAASSTTNLGMNVYPDLKDKNSRFEFRTTTTYDSVNNVFFVGATDGGAKEYAVSSLSTADSGATVTKAALAPAQIYSNPSDTTAALIANPVYNARIWEMSYFPCYGKFYVAAIVQAPTDSGNGGSFLAVINVANPMETYVSGTAMTLDNEAAGTANTASKFVKLAVGDNQAVTAKVVFAAVADPTVGEFDTSKATVGLRAYTAPSSSLTNNSLVELDMVSGTGKGVKLGASANVPSALGMSPNMTRLTSMVWDGTGKVLYLGGYMTGGILGVCGFYLAASDVLTTLNHSSGGTIMNSATNTFPELSCVHRMMVTKLGTGTTPHLIIQSGATPQEKTRFTVLNLTTAGGVGTVGKLAIGASASVASARSQLWIAINASTGTLTSANAARAVLGNAPFPLRNSSTIITGIYTVGTAATTQNVYVTTYNAGSGSEAWVSTITHTSNWASSSTAWKSIPMSSLVKVTGFATDATNVWAILDRKSVYVNSATTTAVTVAQPSLGLANVKDAASHTRLRQVAVFDAVNRALISASTSAPGSGVSPVNTFNPVTGVTAAPVSEAAVSQLLNQPIWDVVTMTNSGVVDKYYLLHDTVVGTQGGKTIVKVPGDGTTATVFTTASFFQDNSSVASRCVKMVAGQDTSGTNRLFCFIADAAAGDSAVCATGGTNGGGGAAPSADVVKVLDANLGVVAATLQLGDIANLPGLRPTSGISTPSDVTTIQSVYFDYTLKVLYVGFQMASGITKPGLVVLKLTSAPALTGYKVFTSDYNGSTLGTDDSIRDVYKISSLRTVGTTPRSILLVSGTLTAQAGTTTAETGEICTGGIYAIPVITAAGGNLGKAATGAGTYTTNAAATSTANMWNQSVGASMFFVGGCNSAAVSGRVGTYPWNIQAAVLDLQVIGLDVYATVANPLGVTGPAGVFRTTALCDSAGNLQGWTPWTPVSGLNSSAQNVALDAVSANVISLDLASGQPIIPTWKQSTDASNYDKLADALNTDFANNGGVYNIAYHKATTGIVYNDAIGTGGTAHMVVATGNQRVAVAQVGFKSATATIPLVVNNPSAADAYSYKSFLNDPALQSLGQIYCSTMSLGTAGWIFVGGQNGIAVLRAPGSGANAGKGWTGAVPSSLIDQTSSSAGIADMTWIKVPGISDSIRKMTIVYDATGTGAALIAMGANGVYGFGIDATADLGKFKDTPSVTNTPTAIFTTVGSERVWDIAPLYRRCGQVLIGTTKGLYIAQFGTGSAGTWGTPTEITDGTASLGSISSVMVTTPQLASTNNLGVNPIFTVDCVTAKARTDAGKHFRFPITLNETTGAVVGTPTAVLVRALDRMASQIISEGAVTTYHAGKPTAKAASVDVLSKTLEGSSSAVSNGLTAAAGTAMGHITIVGTDGTRLVTSGGRVFVQSA